MKHSWMVFGLALLIWSPTVVATSDGEPAFPVLKGPYLGQTPPGDDTGDLCSGSHFQERVRNELGLFSRGRRVLLRDLHNHTRGEEVRPRPSWTVPPGSRNRLRIACRLSMFAGMSRLSPASTR